MNRLRIATWLPGLVLAGVFLALHLPFLPASLEDLDSINFALGIRDYDVAQHQPHPPGYPLFIAAGKALHAVGVSELHALALLSVLGGTLALMAVGALFRHLDRDRDEPVFAWIAAGVVGANPLYWITSARPLSDLAGLAPSIAIQALALSAATARSFALACGAAAFAAGIRSQVVWLTVPALVLALARLPSAERLKAAAIGAMSYLAGALLWLVPLVMVSGGPARYWHALFNQGAEDLTGVTMLATVPTARQLARSLDSALLAPWGYWQAGAVVLVLAVIGLVQLWRHARPSLLALLAGFGPYFVFDLLFQETVTTRYAVPLVIPAAYLAVRGLSLLPDVPAAAFAVALAGYTATIDDHVLPRYAGAEAPAFRMLGDWTAAAREQGPRFQPPALAMHRREILDLRRPMEWRPDLLPSFSTRIPSVARYEWLEVVKYWNSGGRAPVWFVGDPLRSDLALIRGDRRPQLYRWGFEPILLVGGSRPSQMDWHVFTRPQWYLGEGWALTPETAGIAHDDHRGPGYAPVQGWIRRTSGPSVLMIGGRNLTTAGGPAATRVAIDGREIGVFAVAPGFFLRWIDVPSLAGAGDYATVSVGADSADLAIEQFDAQPAGQLTFGFGDGWYEMEADPATGQLWRWSSDRATLRVRAEGHAAALTLRGEIDAGSSSHVVVRAGDAIVAEFDADRRFGRTIVIPSGLLSASETAITIESSVWYVPAESRRGSSDRRRLALKLYECQITPAS